MLRLIRLLALTMASLMSLQACGRSSESSETLAPLIDQMPTTSVTAILSAEDVAAATNAWRRTSAVFTGLFSQEPFVSDDQIYAVAALSDLRPSDDSIMESAAVLMIWEDREWSPLEQFDSECYQTISCEITVIGEGVLSRPVIVITWCCPMDLTPLKFPVAIVLHVVDQKLTDFISPEAVSPDFSPHFISLDNPSEMRFHECLEQTEYGPGEYPNSVVCNHKVETLYQLSDDGTWLTEKFEYFSKTPISECLLDVPDGGCQIPIEITPSDACPDPIRNDDRFPLRLCQYGLWFYEFEQSLTEIGYDVVVDGYYNSSEIDIIKRFQRDSGLDADGLVGPLTWRTARPFSICTPAAADSGELGPCTEDMNNDGVYGPGDILPL